MPVRWFRTVVLAAALADGLAGAAALAQSPVAFPKEVYAARRRRLADQVKGAAIVVPGKYLVGAHELPKQDADFWYLTGVESPYAMLVIAPDSRPDAAPGAIRTALFLPDSFQFAGAQFPHVDPAFRRAPWNVPRQRLAPGPGAVEATGISETYRVQQFASRVGDIVGQAKIVYLPMRFDSLYAPLGMREPRSVEQQVTKAIGDVLGARDLKDVTPLIRRKIGRAHV